MVDLGVPYGEELENAEKLAKDQAAKIAQETVDQGGPAGLADKKVIALIAYLQRLGTDLFKTASEPALAGDLQVEHPTQITHQVKVSGK